MLQGFVCGFFLALFRSQNSNKRAADFLTLFSCIIYNVFLLCEVVSEQFRRQTHCIMPTYQCPYSYLSVIAPLDQYTFLENCPPTSPLSQHFALSQGKPEGFKFPCGIRDPGHWNPGLGSKNPLGMWNPVPGIRNRQLGIQNPALSWITLHEATVKLALNIATS